MKQFFVIAMVVAVVVCLIGLLQPPKRQVLLQTTNARVQATTKVTDRSPDEEKFFSEVWPVAKANIFNKLAALRHLGVISPLDTDESVKVTRLKFAGQRGSVVCRAVVNDRIAISYHDLERGNRRFRGISSFKEIGVDEHGVPYDEDHIRSRLNDPRVSEAEKMKLKATFSDTNLYPRLSKERASEIAKRILESFEERPDLYKPNPQRPFESQVGTTAAANYVFIFDRVGQKPTANLTELDRVFIVLRSEKNGVHLQRYDSSYHDFEAEASLYGRE